MVVPTKPGYICSALTELPEWARGEAKRFYSALADEIGEELGTRPWVPHEHFDPVAHAHFTPEDVKRAEKEIVCEQTDFLFLVAIEPSWGGGIEVGWAEDRGIPIFVLAPKEKFESRKLSRLLRGCATKLETYDDVDDGLAVAKRMVRGLIT